MVSEEADRHEFLFREWTEHQPQYDPIDPVDLADRVRTFIESLPETASTFRRSQISKQYDDLESQQISNDILWLCGSWEIPEFYESAGALGNLWINPNYVHSHQYPETAVQCECGAVLTGIPGSGGRARYSDESDHKESCLPEHRAECVAEIYRRRREVLRRSALLCHDMVELQDQISYGHDMSSLARNMDVSYENLKNRGYEKRMNTIVALLPTYSTREVARVYGLSPKTVRNHIARHTDHTITELRS